jgi:hypothetical protein
METKLSALIEQYATNKNELDSYKEICDRENKEIKNLMKESNLTLFDTGKHTAKIGVQERTKFDEDRAIMLLQNAYLNKELNKDLLDKLIVQKPCINMEALEKAIYNGDINAAMLAPANTITQVTTLKISLTKEK